MAWRQGHLVQFTYIPSIDDDTSRVGIGLDKVNGSADLVDHLPIGLTPAAPLLTIDWTEVTILPCPLIPYTYAVILEVLDIGISIKEP
jgi:hypothetical protein